MGTKNTVNVMSGPSLEVALDIIREGITRHRVLFVVGQCRVEYRGRAESKLGPGDRLLIIKKDGAVLVHRATGYEPVNWQPGGHMIQTVLRGDTLVIHATRSKPREVLSLFFNRIDLVTQLDLVDHSEFVLYASEHDMQKAIMLYPELVEPGFRPITDNKNVEPGFIDVFGRDCTGNLVVIEIKRKTGGKRAVLQLWKYLQSLTLVDQPRLRGILMAPKLAKGAQRLLETLNLEFKPLSPKKCAELLNKEKSGSLTSFLTDIDENDEVINR